MASGTNLEYDGRPITIVLDRSFFHDAFRTDYAQTESAKWILTYLFYRKALTRKIICYTSSLIINRLAREIRTFPDIPSQMILTLRAITNVYALPQEDMQFDHSTLYLAKILFDNQNIPIILSSVSTEKWRTRVFSAGIEMGFEFEEGMSHRRVEEITWFIPLTSDQCISLYRQYDSWYPRIVESIGAPPIEVSS